MKRERRNTTLEPFLSTRAEIGRLASELALLRDGLEEHAAKVELSTKALLPCIYRGTIETICRDLLDDAVETLLKLGQLTEEQAERRVLEAVDLLAQLRTGHHEANASSPAA